MVLLECWVTEWQPLRFTRIKEGKTMTEKNKKKLEQKAKRKSWVGLYPRKTKTKREKEESLRKKHKGREE